MQTRRINPTPRIQTIFYFAGLVDDRLFFKFDQDSVIHQVTSSAEFTCDVGVSCHVGGGFNVNSTGAMAISPGFGSFVHAYSCNALFADPVRATYQNSTPMSDTIIKSGNVFRVSISTTGVAVTTPVRGYFSVIFTPLSEWVNFREPGIAVRL